LKAGFSEEMELPFNVDRILDRDFPEAKEFREAMRTGYMADLTDLLVKSGMLGNVFRVFAENTQQEERIEYDVICINNSMHSGAIGGPVFNEDGDAIGVVSQRAITRIDVGDEKVHVPSGCTVAPSLAPLNYILKSSVNKSPKADHGNHRSSKRLREFLGKLCTQRRVLPYFNLLYNEL
jgi:hypothetical protein